MFAMMVEEELESWPEQDSRCRTWLSISEAANSCRHPWMREALMAGFDDTNNTVVGEGEAV